MTDSPLPGQFVMDGVHEVLEIAGDADHLKRQVAVIEHAINTEPSLAFDMSRSMVESVCKAILRECRGPIPGKMDRLVRETCTALQLVPNQLEHQKAREALEALAVSLDSAILSISNLRKEEGIASHGKDITRSSLGRAHAEFAARSADAIVSFLFRLHRERNVVPQPPPEYEDSPDANQYIDSNNEPVSVLGVSYLASEVLYHVDLEAYKAAVSDYMDQAGGHSEEEQ